jgi:hypothetical protein
MGQVPSVPPRSGCRFATTAVERSETPFGKDRTERLFSPKRTDLL